MWATPDAAQQVTRVDPQRNSRLNALGVLDVSPEARCLRPAGNLVLKGHMMLWPDDVFRFLRRTGMH